MSKSFVKVEDFTKAFLDVIETLKVKRTLVGIPEGENSRNEEGQDQPIGNAALLYINNFGSPANNIPPRPVMSIGIFNAQDEIAEQMKKSAIAGFKQGAPAIDKYYQRTGIIASNSIKRTINDQIGIEPISFATELGRKRRGFMGEKALIVTGQMRNAITYVVED